MATIQKITPNLWFDNQAEEAAKFYTSIFPDSSIGNVSRYGKEGFEIHRMPEGTAMTVDFTLNGLRFLGLNGGPVFKFTEAVSFIIDCKDQNEIDHYWNRLNEGGDPNSQQCGWLKDKFGLSWQVVPEILGKLMSDPDKEKAGRTMNAMLGMKKLVIAELLKAHDGN